MVDVDADARKPSIDARERFFTAHKGPAPFDFKLKQIAENLITQITMIISF